MIVLIILLKMILFDVDGVVIIIIIIIIIVTNTITCVTDEEELVDTGRLSAEERNALFASGLTQEKQGKKGAALKCYLGCLSGLTKDTRFVLLPQCLRNVSALCSPVLL